MSNVKVGDTVRIIELDDCGYDEVARSYSGKEGKVTYIDDRNQLHGTWGSLAIIPEVDKFEVINIA